MTTIKTLSRNQWKQFKSDVGAWGDYDSGLILGILVPVVKLAVAFGLLLPLTAISLACRR